VHGSEVRSSAVRISEFLASTAFEAFDYTDGGIYKTGTWQPEYDFKLSHGECFVFPPGYFHETLVREEDNPDEPCTVATTFQFNSPLPARYWRNYLPRLMNSHLSMDERGDELWGQVATVSGKLKKPTLNVSLVRKQAQATFSALDKDMSGSLLLPELEAHFKSNKGAWASERSFVWFDFVSGDNIKEQLRQEVKEELAAAYAEAVLRYHDLDSDGVVVPEELLESMWQWNVLAARRAKIASLKRRAKRHERDMNAEVRRTEEHFLRSFACTGSPSAVAACGRLAELPRQEAERPFPYNFPKHHSDEL